MYYEAGRGNYTWQPSSGPEVGGFVWCYSDWLSVIWTPFTLVSFKVASWIFYFIQLANFAYLSNLILGYEYGWLLVVAFTKTFAVCLRFGNVAPLLVSLAISGPMGAAVAALHKPYYAPFVIFHVFPNLISFLPVAG
jgi:hypothetical protein